MKHAILPILLAFFCLASCRHLNGERVRGNGKMEKEQRSTADFRSVEVRGAISLFVRMDSSNSVSIEAEDNLQEYIETRVDGGKLIIGTRNGFNLNPTRTIKAYVTAPYFEELEASGACSITSESLLTSDKHMEIDISGASKGRVELRCPSVSADLSGASNIRLSGETRDLSLGASGSSRIDAIDLLAENVEVDLSGASHATVFSSVSLDVDASGASDVKYRGEGRLTSETSGASSVKKID